MATSYDSSAFLADLAATIEPPSFVRQAAASERAHRPIGSTFFGPYEMLGEVGSGGVAQVFRARHVHPAYAQRPMALKLLHEASNDNVRIVQLFRREAGVQSLIRHANIVETFEAGIQDGKPFLAMEFVLGGDLDHLLTRLGRKGMIMPPALAAYIMSELLAGLEYAHALKDLSGESLALVHRDVNPANCFLSQMGEVKLGDFGVASIITEKKRREAEIAGKAGYFAPEHLANQPMDARADLYGAGATLFEMLAGRRLFLAADDEEVIALNEQGALPNMEALLPPAAKAMLPILACALARRPTERYASAQQMREALLPMAAPAKEARLLLMALVRQFFSRELSRERRLLAFGHSRRPSQIAEWRGAFGHAPRVALALSDADGVAAMAELLGPLGYDAFDASSAEGAQRSADVVVLTHEEGRPARRHLQELPSYVRGHTACIFTADYFSLSAAREAAEARARDLWVRPFRASRVADALEDLLTYRLEGRESRRQELLAQPPRAAYGRALLAVGPGARAMLAQASLDEGDLVTYAADAQAALDKTNHASFDAVVVDATSVADVASFLQRFRGTIGMGIVPAVGVCMQPGLFTALPDRFVVARADDDVAAALLAAQRSAMAGDARAYTRFDVALPVRLRFAGREFRAETVNVSRRGLLLSTPFLPSVGTELGLHIELPAPLRKDVGVTARAQRAILRPTRAAHVGGFEMAQLGVALGRFASSAEAVWVQLILAQPPPPGAGVLERAARWLGRS